MLCNVKGDEFFLINLLFKKKKKIFKFLFDRIEDPHGKANEASSLNIVIYLFYVIQRGKFEKKVHNCSELYHVHVGLHCNVN